MASQVRSAHRGAHGRANPGRGLHPGGPSQGCPVGHYINQILTVGLIAGIGIGLGYVCPIAVGMRWFPDKKGLITGLAVAGFGLVLWSGCSWRASSVASWRCLGVSGVFYSLWHHLCGWGSASVPSGWSILLQAGCRRAGRRRWPQLPAALQRQPCRPRQMLRTPQFYAIWVMFVFCAKAGLLVIGNISSLA